MIFLCIGNYWNNLECREVSLEGELTSSYDGRMTNRRREWRRSRRAIACKSNSADSADSADLALSI